MWILSPKERSETKKALQIHSGNVNFESQGKLRNTENITGSITEMQIVSARGSSETQKILWIRSGNANWECQGKRRNTENTTDPQRKCEIWVPGKAPKHRKHYKSIVEIRIVRARKNSETLENVIDPQWKCEFWVPGNASETQKTLKIHSGNANCEGQGKLRNIEKV